MQNSPIVNLLLEKYFMFGEMPMDVVGTLPERAKDFVEDMLYTLEAKRKSALAGVLSKGYPKGDHKGYPKGDHKGYPRGDKIYNTIDTNIKETQQQPRAGARGGVCVVVVFLLLMVM